MCLMLLRPPVAAAAVVKGFDEDSVASLSTTQDETPGAENGVAHHSSHPFAGAGGGGVGGAGGGVGGPGVGGGYMFAASYWPKVRQPSLSSVTKLKKNHLSTWSRRRPLQDRVIINRLDSICQAVLKGKWPGTRRVYEPGGAVASFYTTKLLDNANSLSEDPSASPQGSKVTKHVAENKEFSVKLNDVC